MTTGRINQVTIVRPRTPKGPKAIHRKAMAESLTTVGGALPERAATLCFLEQVLNRSQLGHPVTHMVFPKGRSAMQQVRRRAPSLGMACNPQEGDTASQSRTRRLLARAYPRVSGC